MHEAMRVVRAVRDVDVYIEQPCLSYEECLTVRRHTRPSVRARRGDRLLDVLLRGHADRAMDVVNLKISKFGGLTKARQARDLCVSLGIAMTLEDSWGGDIVTAAIAHLAHSTPPEFLFTATDFNSYVTVSTADGRAAARQRPHGGLDRARPRRRAADGRARRAGRRQLISTLDASPSSCKHTQEHPPMRRPTVARRLPLIVLTRSPRPRPGKGEEGASSPDRRADLPGARFEAEVPR